MAPPAVDVGVDLESGVLRLAVVGEVAEALWAGHFAYWEAINRDLSGVGGRFEVELVRVDTMSDARTVGALAVSLRVDGDDRLPADLLVAAPAGLPAGSGLTNLAVVDTPTALQAGRRSLVLGEPAVEGVSEYAAEILVALPGAGCDGEIWSDASVGVVRGLDGLTASVQPNLYYLCTPVAETLAAAAAALNASPGSVLVVPGSAWRPELAEQLDGSSVFVVGYIPEPGLEASPASEVMAGVLGPGPWAGGEVEGYLAALSMHAILERSLAAGDLSRMGVMESEQSLGSISLGFGEDRVAVGRLEVGSPTGVRILDWVVPGG